MTNTSQEQNIFAQPARKYIAEPLARRYDRHYHPRHRHGRFHMTIDLLLVIATVGLIAANAYLYWAPQRSGITLPMDMTITMSPATITTGGGATITIDFTSTGKKSVQNGTLSIDLPPSFDMESATAPERFNGNTTSWQLGELMPTTRGTYSITGTFWGAPGKQEEVMAQVMGVVEDDSERALATASKQTLVAATASALAATVEIPSTVALNQQTNVKLELSNVSGRDLNELVLSVGAPDSWRMSASSLPMGREGILLPEFKTGATVTITFTGRYERPPTSPSFFFRVSGKRGGKEQELLTARADTILLDPGFEMKAEVVGDAGVAKPGAEISVKISYHHRGEFPVDDVVLGARIVGPYVDPIGIAAIGGTVSDGIAQWSSQNLSQLSQIVPNQNGELKLNVKTRENISLVDRSPLDDFSIIVQPTAIFRSSILPEKRIEWFGQALTIMPDTVVAVSSASRYYTAEGEQIGRGPLPPRVGAKTTYWVSVNVANTIHDAYEARVEIPLGNTAQWTGRSSVTTGGQLQFDPSTRTFIWILKRIDNFLGPTPPTISASIEVAVVPERGDFGKTMILLKPITLKAVDAITKTPLVSQAPVVTTATPADQRAAKKSDGVVR